MAASGKSSNYLIPKDIEETLKNRGRRKSVCAEKYDPEQDQSQDKLVIHHKSDEQKQRLKEAVSDVFLLTNLEPEQLSQVLDAMSERKVKSEECVIKQGDDGDNFYVIDSGTYDVYIDDNGKNRLVTQYDNKGSFGELALMYNTPRTATVVATSNGSLWALDRVTFRTIIVKHACNKRIKYEQLLKSVPQLLTLTEYERTSVADALTCRKFSDGECIMKQGGEADGMYFIEEGRVDVRVYDAKKGSEVSVCTLQTGQYFGELALVIHQTRSASVYATSDVKLAFLEVGAFERLLGPCVDLMKRNIKLYEEQLSSILGQKAKIRGTDG